MMHRLPRALTLRQTHPRFCRRLIPPTPRRFKSQIVYRPTGEAIRYQAVRFQRPRFTSRRLATIALYSGAVYAYLSLVWRYLDVEIEILDDQENVAEERKTEQHEGGEMMEELPDAPYYAEEDSTFIPLTWAKKMPRQFYRGSDLEWQEFVKIAKDKTRHKKIQDELVQIVYVGSVQHPVISRQLGTEPKVGKYWLDISFPDGPPQEYERSGIEIGDGFVAWSQQKVSQEKQWRLMRALWPQAAFDSVWATTKVLAGIQYRRVKQALGWEGRDPFSPEERYKHAVEMAQKQQQARERKGVGSAQTSPDGSPDASSVSSTRDAPSPSQKPQAPSKSSTTTTTTTTTSASDSSRKLPWQISVPMPSSSTAVNTDLPIAMHVFSATLSKSWKPQKIEPPRGTFVVQGLVEVRGGRGRMLFDVQSCYDPKASKFVAVSAAVRNFKRWNQAPKGGP